jgi:hypothetical protein
MIFKYRLIISVNSLILLIPVIEIQCFSLLGKNCMFKQYPDAFHAACAWKAY